MEMLEKVPPDVLIYLQNIRIHVTNNEIAKEYFKIETHGEDFFDAVFEIAKNNYETNGTPELSIEQFEEIRRKIFPAPKTYGVFINLGELGFLSLN